jgi:hypothetical protein
MLNNKHLKQWSCIVSERISNLSIPQAIGLATWSFGMVMTLATSLTQVSEFIGAEEKAKKGDKRRTLDVSKCFASLLWLFAFIHN